MLKKFLYFILFTIITFILIIAFNFQKDIPLENLKKKWTNEESEYLDLNGMKVHYRDEGQGEPIVLIHGTAASLHTWDDWTNELKKNYRVIRMDIPAFGLTGPDPEHDYSIKNYTDFIDGFVNKIGLNGFALAGNSLGGQIAWNYAADHPTKVKELILLDPAGYPSSKAKPLIFQIAKTPILNVLVKYITPISIIRKNIEEVYFDDSKVSDALVKRYHEMSLRAGNRDAFIARVKTVFDDTSEKLKSIKSPSLIIWGKEDYWIPVELAPKYHNDIPNSELFIMENVGHVPMEENPDKSVQRTIEFLEKN